MSWSSHGSGRNEWTYDHIMAMDWFDFSKEDHKKIGMHWSNVQPSTHNFEKHNHIYLHEIMNGLISAHRFIIREQLNHDNFDIIKVRIAYFKSLISFRSPV